MKLRSLGYRSQLIFIAFDGKSTNHGDHLALHTLSNPNFYWGNLLIFDRPPKQGDFAKWTEAFRREFKDPKIYHVTLAWDCPTGEVGDVNEFLEHGYLLESTAVLSAQEVVRPPKFNKQLHVRPIHGADEWERTLEIQIATAHGPISRADWEIFYRNQNQRYQAMENAGFGHWYGGFLNGELIAGLGIFYRDGVGRFQTVCTHPKFQRQGICQTLVYLASQAVLESGQVQDLVMCADPEYHAITIYESVGFKRQLTEHGVYWWDKQRSTI